MKNRFNNLTSKQWLPFQKSWFHFDRLSDLFTENILFFTQVREEEGYYPNILIQSNGKILNELMNRPELKHRRILSFDENPHLERIDFAIFDLVDATETLASYPSFETLLADLQQNIKRITQKLMHRKFILILAKNRTINGKFFPFAWLIAKHFQQILSLKDEKIGIKHMNLHHPYSSKSIGFVTKDNPLYALYFRKDELSTMDFDKAKTPAFHAVKQLKTDLPLDAPFPSHQIVKPPPRKKNEVLHPAKYPEVLIESFIQHFSKTDENVFDPMSGTGSTQLAALQLHRNAYGTELSPFFADIARQRCEQLQSQTDLFEQHNNQFLLKTKDAREIKAGEFPPIHYIITSPPYWDMLNMKGAENQAKRRQKGLQTNYSDSEQDLGNIADYNQFVRELVQIYFGLYDLLEPGRYMTIIVKNIKKKGRNFPLAWDLSLALTRKFILCPESFWFQDDLRIAPYGYGNTWVSNTFHHYCLTFQKPKK